jgi:predicted MFS family arabinose efflux permease
MGAAAGAVVIANGAVERLGWVAAGFAVAALLSVLLSGSGTSGRSDGGGDAFSSEASP